LVKELPPFALAALFFEEWQLLSAKFVRQNTAVALASNHRICG